jgi:hypothetical protein
MKRPSAVAAGLGFVLIAAVLMKAQKLTSLKEAKMKHLVRVGVSSVLLLLGASCSGGGGGETKDGSNDTADSSSTDSTGDHPDSGGTDASASADVSDADLKTTEVDASDDTAETGPDVHAEGGSDSPIDGKACGLPIAVGCFSGDVCASPQVQAVCMNGAWSCPAGSHPTEICAPDAGFDVSSTIKE